MAALQRCWQAQCCCLAVAGDVAAGWQQQLLSAVVLLQWVPFVLEVQNRLLATSVSAAAAGNLAYMVRYLRRRGVAVGSSLVLVAISAVRACSDDNQALKAALSGGTEPCRVPMCRHRCSAAAAEGLCEADRGGSAVRAACPAACGMCGDVVEDDLSHLDIGERCDVARVADASTMSAAQFLQDYVLPQRPVVLGGLLDHWPARRWAGVESNGAR